MSVPILFNEKSECCGCGSCVNICPRNAIALMKDEVGYLYPKIDEYLCIHCPKCINACNYKTSTLSNVPQEVYAAVTVNTDIMQSSSGGTFASIATNVLRNDGIVYGAAMKKSNDVFSPEMMEVSAEKDLHNLLGSKYVQCDAGDIYSRVKKNLLAGKTVLFSGTPCQVDALYAVLENKRYSNLITIDLICHGVPSAKMFNDYINFFERKNNCIVNSFTFRKKSKKDSGFVGTAECQFYKKGKTIKIYSRESSYYYLFLSGMIYRENCYRCKYACQSRVGDLTIGDYWGVEQFHANELRQSKNLFSIEKGISCLIVNTEQGKKALSCYGDGLKLLHSSFDNVARNNHQLNYPTRVDFNNREKLLKTYVQEGYDSIEEWFNKSVYKHKVLARIYNRLPNCMKKFVKKLKIKIEM